MGSRRYSSPIDMPITEPTRTSHVRRMSPRVASIAAALLPLQGECVERQRVPKFDW
jgi:hypothetical protein